MKPPHPLAGSSLTNLLRFAWRHGREIEAKHVAQFAKISAAVVASTPLRLAESLCFGRKVRKQAIHPSPIVVLGHWRSGTTHMQNLLLCDDQFATVSLLHCSVPHLHLVLGRILGPLIEERIAAKRPMDNVKLGIHEPMSEDFGLVGRSEMTHYHSYFLPKKAEAEFRRTVLLESNAASETWQRDYLRLLRKVSYESGGKRLCLKNPPSTGRVAHVLKLFPDAKFVFVKRNPYVVHASTCRLMEKFLQQFALQSWDSREIESFVSRRYELLMQRWFADRSLIPPANLIEVRHEDVTDRPIESVRAVYDQFGLQDFERTKPTLERLVAGTRSYQNNKYEFSPDYLERIEPYVGPVAARWGYSVPASPLQDAA
ncbi:MAG: sulfotransferase [Planctomycetaceae bacterium]